MSLRSYREGIEDHAAIDKITFLNLLRDIPALRWLPGKSESGTGLWLPTWLHLMDTAGVMVRLITEWLPSSVFAATRIDEDRFARVCRFLALTHDIGKMTPLFVARLVQTLPGIRIDLENCGISSLNIGSFHTRDYNSPHALAGCAILHRLGCPDGIASVVGAHHGKPQANKMIKALSDDQFNSCFKNYYGYISDGCKDYSDSPEGKLWSSIRSGWLDLALAESGHSSPSELPELNIPSQVLASGLLIMADWIASNTHYFPLLTTDELGEDVDLESRLDDAMAKLALPDNWSPCVFTVSSADFKNEFGFAQNDIQCALAEAAASSTNGGIYILEAPMGCGKTEAALAAAEVLASKNGLGGVFFGLPTQATANGIFDRIKAWGEHQSDGTLHAIRLAHGMAELNEDYRALFEGNAITNEDGENGGLIAHSWFKGNKQALLANFVIGTIDQLLMAALKQKHVMLRHLGLAGKVIIIDECHAYDAYMNQYLDMAIRWLGAYRVPVIILSATLPSSRRTTLIARYLNKRKINSADDAWSTCRDYPLLTWSDGSDVNQKAISLAEANIKIKIDRISDDDLVDQVRDVIAAEGCAGVIVNTVARSQMIAKRLRESLPGADVLLFHSHFTMHDRAKREFDLLSRVGKSSTTQSRRCLVVVGTQVLEQSLDIDFDFLVTDLCPMDLMLQRLGRLHRHQWRKRPDKLREARCALLDAVDEKLVSGSQKVYGDWALLKARNLIPDTITLPDDIADLVQNAYDAEDDDADIKRAFLIYDKDVKKKMSKADTYCLAEPSFATRKTINGMLNTDVSDKEDVGRAAVRDGIITLSVIMMVRHDDGTVGFVPWACDGAIVDAHHEPSGEIARKIAAQRVNLPYIFNIGGRYDEAVDALEIITNTLSEWKRSPWLDGELVLLLDERNEAELCGFSLRYTEEEGLIFEAIEKEDTKKGRDGDE